LLLPIQEDEQINFALLEAEINALITYQVDGIYSFGTTNASCQLPFLLKINLLSKKSTKK